MGPWNRQVFILAIAVGIRHNKMNKKIHCSNESESKIDDGIASSKAVGKHGFCGCRSCGTIYQIDVLRWTRWKVFFFVFLLMKIAVRNSPDEKTTELTYKASNFTENASSEYLLNCNCTQHKVCLLVFHNHTD